MEPTNQPSLEKRHSTTSQRKQSRLYKQLSLPVGGIPIQPPTLDLQRGILEHLSAKNPQYHYEYKDFQTQNKTSSNEEVVKILEEMLSLHDSQGLCASEQYIFSGYLTKFIEEEKDCQRIAQQRLKLTKRVQGSEGQTIREESPDPQQSAGRRKSAKEEKMLELRKFSNEVKFLWQMYQLKVATCPDIARIDRAIYRDITDIFGKVKEIERTRMRIGEEKLYSMVKKALRQFESQILALLR